MPTTLQARLGKAVRRLRKKFGYSQESFADHCGVHRTFMVAVERGETNISLKNIERISRALGIKASELLRAAKKERRSKALQAEPNPRV